MGERRHEVERCYPPDYVSAETLAYRLDCSVTEIDDLMCHGLLPRPGRIGTLMRWDFSLVRAYIRAQNETLRLRLGSNGQPGPEDDPYLAGLERGTSG